jgi:uncharacterized membrane protein
MTSPDTIKEAVSPTKPAPPPRAEREDSTSRLEAFSDGVFAVAITLLVLDIKVPSLTNPDGTQMIKDGQPLTLLRALADQWPTYVSYLTSFIFIGIIWLNHHDIFKDIKRNSHTLIVINLLLLLSVSLIPFPTSLLAEYITNPDANTAATAVFSGALLLMAIAFNLLWLYVLRAGLVRDDLDPKVARTRTRANLLGATLYLISFAFAFINVYVSIGIYTFVALLFLIINALDLS